MSHPPTLPPGLSMRVPHTHTPSFLSPYLGIFYFICLKDAPSVTHLTHHSEFSSYPPTEPHCPRKEEGPGCPPSTNETHKEQGHVYRGHSSTLAAQALGQGFRCAVVWGLQEGHPPVASFHSPSLRVRDKGTDANLAG